jgi:hypothetical protein
MTVDRIACLDKFKALRSAGYSQSQAMSKVVYDFAGLNFYQDEDNICNLETFLSMNDTAE